MDPRERLIVALDRSSRDEILRLAEEIHGFAGMVKIGLQAFVANGPSIVRELVAAGERVFLDLKFHDIPNTASRAVSEAAALGASIINVHAAGGGEMMRACAKALSSDRKPLLIAVTALTSLGDRDLDEIGMRGDSRSVVARLARLTLDSGLDGVVASPREIAIVRETCGESFAIVTPGIRGATDAARDQKRTMTANEAIAAGATYIVVGRPITDAEDRRGAARAIVDEMA